MSQPPDLPADELWLELTQLPRPHRSVEYPRKAKDGSVRQLEMLVLTQTETMAITASAERWVRARLAEAKAQAKKDEQSFAYEALYESRSSCELLFRCCRRVGDLDKGFFPTPDAIAATLTTDEVAVLVLKYSWMRAELGPIVHEMSEAECKAWIDRIAEGSRADPLGEMSLGVQSQLMRFMASRLCSSPTDSSSPGGLPEST